MTSTNIHRLDRGSSARRFGTLVALLVVLDGRAFAIPSPDVVVNLFASAAQVLGLVSIVAGSWFFGRKRRGASGERSGRAWRLAFVASSALFVVAALGWTFFALHVHDQRQRALQVNLERSSKEDGRQIVDVSLKELSFSQQLERDDGIETGDLEALRAAGRFSVVYDVRESEEYEVGRLQGIAHVRYPDLMAAPSKYLKRNQRALLLCFNGNRSSEMCAALRELDYDVWFLVGGYEKWIAEERPLEMAEDHARAELRELPAYPNDDVLLGTEDVFALQESHDVLFVDVRYPGEYTGLGHLPGAINVPARKLTTPDLDAALRALPRKPVVIPCYDKRSSFYAAIIGLKLSRLGYEFLGRYTTPESYWAPGKDKPHVAAWKARQAEKTLLAGVEAPLESALGWLAGLVGGLALAIVLFVVLARLAVLPLTAKADRDRLVQAGLAPRIAEIAARCAGDGRAQSKLTFALLREHRVRPIANLAASIAQLVLFTVCFGVVGDVARDSTERFLWVPALGTPDPLYLLPALAGLLVAALILLSVERPGRKRVIAAVICAPALALLVQGLSAASNLYLVTSFALLLVQSRLVRAWLRRASERRIAARPALPARAVAALHEADRVPGCGNKALRLAELLHARLPVPEGFVVTCTAIDAFRASGRWSSGDREAIEAAFERLGAERVAVRSSGLREDGADKSYAGVFESVLDVRRAELFQALEEVARSLDSGRARAYADGTGERGGIVVQAMVPAEFAGVLFTEHPGSSGAAAVELVRGLGEALVSGRADPISLRLGRVSGRPLDDVRAPLDLAPLFALGRRVEALFGRPQDIEWAYADGRFQLLQARDVTRLASHGDSARALRERERARLLALARGAAADEVVLARNELSELLPRPTPYSHGLMERLWAHDGSADRACREAGVPYDVLPDSEPYVVTAFGSTFVHAREQRRRTARAPGALASFRLSRAAEALESGWRDEFLPPFQREARLREALDLTRLTIKELVELHDETVERIVRGSYLEAERINVAADLYFKSAVRLLEKRGLDPARYLGHLPRTVVTRALEALRATGRPETDVPAFLKLFAHRAPQDYELSQPRYAESPKTVRAMAQRSSSAQPARSEAPAPVPAPVPGGRVLALAVERARRFQSLKEEAKHHALRDHAFLRGVLVELGERIDAGDDIFLLDPAEIALLVDARFRQDTLPALVRERLDRRLAFETVDLARDLTLHDLERLDLEQVAVVGSESKDGLLRGLRVSGGGEVVGRARVLTLSEEIDQFQDGEVLVARFTDPTWTPIFPRARGIVTEVGGWLSHAAIQARECEVTAIVGVAGALSSLRTGDLVALRTDGSVERLEERRVETRYPSGTAIELRREQEALAAELADVSLHGGLVHVPGQSLEIGESISIRCTRVGRDFEATVVRNGIPGVYGVRFARGDADLLRILTGRGAAAVD